MNDDMKTIRINFKREFAGWVVYQSTLNNISVSELIKQALGTQEEVRALAVELGEYKKQYGELPTTKINIIKRRGRIKANDSNTESQNDDLENNELDLLPNSTMTDQ